MIAPGAPSGHPGERPPDWPRRWRLSGARLLRSAAAEPEAGEIEVRDGRIVALGPTLPPADPGVVRLERPGSLVMPGFVEAHLHLCQALFRGLAEGRPLTRWLRERVWPLEAAHDPETLRASARLGLAEAALAGATAILDMGTVRHTDVIGEEAERSGLRVTIGKALMDVGDGVPSALIDSPEAGLAEALALDRRWRGAGQGRIATALAPRFTLSVSASLWRDLARAAAAEGLAVHTHVSETDEENELCRAVHGLTPVRALARWGILDARSVLVHGVRLSAEEIELLAGHDATLVHCPGSNAKLGSGIADLAAWQRAGVPIALGSDGAACNNDGSPLAEMRLAAQLQALRQGPGLIRAQDILAMATSGGARALGLEAEISALAVGRRADLIVFAPEALPWESDTPIATHLVYAAASARPAEVFVDGRPVVQEGRLVNGDLEEIRREARQARAKLLARAALG